MIRVLIVATLAVLLFVPPAMAKDGLYLGLDLIYNDFSADLGHLDSGNGFGLRGGIGIGRYFGLEAEIFKTDHDLKNGGGTVDFKGGTLDAKLNFPLSGSHIEPYIFGGVGTYKLDYPTRSRDGKGGQLGIGIDIYLFPELNLNVGLSRKNINFDSTATEPSMKGKVTTLDLGLSYHFI